MIKSIHIISAIIFCLPLEAMAQSPMPPAKNRNAKGVLHYVRVGVLAHDVDNLWSGHRREEGVDFNAEVVFNMPLLEVLSGIVRPNLGVSINDQGNTSKVYGGMLWEVTGKTFFFGLGLGAAWHDGELETSNPSKKSLGSRILFRIPLEVGLTVYGPHRISIMFDHMSNGYLASPNEGLNTLGLRYSYLFK
jgi:lipid A 3-O-deacylase